MTKAKRGLRGEGMIRAKAERKIRRKISRVRPCPFCGNIPVVRVRCDKEHSSHGSWGHYAVREGCCKATGQGSTELFFCNKWEKPDYRLWWSITSSLVNDWNTRVNT